MTVYYVKKLKSDEAGDCFEVKTVTPQRPLLMRFIMRVLSLGMERELACMVENGLALILFFAALMLIFIHLFTPGFISKEQLDFLLPYTIICSNTFALLAVINKD